VGLITFNIPSRKNIIAAIVVFLSLIGLPVIIWQIGRTQDIRQKAAETSALDSSPQIIVIDGKCSQDNGLVVVQEGAIIENYLIKNVREAGIRVEAPNVTIRNVEIVNPDCDGSGDQFAAGVACWQPCTGLKVLDSKITGNSARRGNGIWMKNTNSSHGIGNHYIARNVISSVWDGIGSEAEGDAWGGFVANSLVEANRITNCADDGIQMEGRNENITVRRNEISGCGIGIAYAPSLVGPLYIENNYIHNLITGDYGQQACYKVGSNSAGDIFISGERCFGPGDGIKQTNSGSLGRVVSHNNCYIVTRYVVEYTSVPQAPSGTSLNFEGDTMFSSDPSRFVKWNGSAISFEQFNTLPQVGTEVLSQNCPNDNPIITPSPTLTPIFIPSPTPTVAANQASILFDIKLVGIGSNTVIGQNPNPIRSSIPLEVQILSTQNQPVLDTSGLLTYNSSTSSFQGNVNLGSSLSQGAYIIKIRLNNTLRRSLITQVNLGQTTGLAPQELILGDLDQNNELNLLDYNALISCYGSKSCSNKEKADLNLDGKVDELDLNIFYAALAKRIGD